MIFIDTETTGLLKPDVADLSLQPSITEICAIRLDDDYEFLGQVNTLINPEVEIPEFITKITGIDAELVKDKPTFIEVYDELVDLFLGEQVVVAHNAPFDMGMLWTGLARHGLEYKFPWPPIWQCTAEASMKIEGRRLKLRDLHELATGRKHEEGAHRADADVHALIRCHKWLTSENYV